jgi:two-component system, NtrC family, response regulator HydG
MVRDIPILLVENNEREARSLKTILEEEGFVVDISSSGWAALEKTKLRTYASVILDFGLSDMKGDELAERIKLENPGMMVILLTGFLHAVEAKNLEMFKYIFEKPADPKKIIKALKEITKDFK